MNIQIYQILMIIFAIFALSRVTLQRRNKTFNLNEFIFWSGVWIALILVSFSKPLLDPLAKLLGFSRGVDLLIYGSITLLFYMVYRLYAKVDKQQQEITSLVNKIAVENAKTPKVKK